MNFSRTLSVGRMKCIALLVLTGMVGGAAAGPPEEASIAGDWWSEDPAVRIVLRADRTATMFEREDRTRAEGRWGLKGSRLSLTWSVGKTSTYECGVIDDQLSLKSDSVTLTLRREDPEAREKELAGCIHQLELLKKAFGTASDNEEIRKTVEGAARSRERRSLLMSLLAGRGDDSLELVRRVLQKNFPEDLPLLEERDGGKLDRSCSNSLKQLGIYLALFEAKFKKYPEKLDQVKRPDMATDESLFTCPLLGEGHRYVYVWSKDGDATSSEALTLYCDAPHTDGQRRFVTFSGRAWEIPEEAFQEVLRTGSIVGVIPALDDLRTKLEDAGDCTDIVATFVGRRLRPVLRDGKSKFRVTVTARLSNMDLERQRPPEETEGPAIGDGMELEVRWRVPKACLEGGAHLTLGFKDESTGRSVDAWESLRR